MNKNNEILGMIGGIILVIFVGVGVYLMAKPENTVNDSQLMRSEFMEGCMEDGNYRFCDCAYDELLGDLGVGGIIKLSLAFEETGEFSDDVYDIVGRCIDKL